MLCVYEFEIFENEGMYVVFPFELEGGTQGETFQEACEMAADWLYTTATHCVLNDIDMPEPKFGHDPQEGGKVVIVAVEVGKETIRKVSPAEASRRLGVTPGRVTQMMDAGQLETFVLDGRRWVTEDSVNARLADPLKVGRPRKTAPVA